MKITINTIPHADQRYNTVGDWYFDEFGNLTINVSKMSSIRHGAHVESWEREMCIAIHELVEVLLCKKSNITQQSVDEFDNRFETSLRMSTLVEEAGDHPEAPYRRQHSFATGIERQLAYALGVDWYEYDRDVQKLSDSYPKERK